MNENNLFDEYDSIVEQNDDITTQDIAQENTTPCDSNTPVADNTQYIKENYVQAGSPYNNQPAHHTPVYNQPPQYAPPQPPVYNNRAPMPPVYPNQPYTAPNAQHNNPTTYYGYNNYQSQPYTQPKPQAPYSDNQNIYNTNPYAKQNPYPTGAPYTNPMPSPVKPPKQKLPTGTKVFIGIIIGLLVFFIIAFCVSCASNLVSDNTQSGSNPLDSYVDDYNNGYYDDWDYYSGDDYYYDDYYDDDYYNFNFGANNYSGEYIEEEITLQADDGATQEKTGDRIDNSYKADKSVTNITINSLPKDLSSDKYTAKSSFDTIEKSVVAIQCYYDEKTDNAEDILSEGTGVIITKDGYIATNSHIIGDCKAYRVYITLSTGEEYEADIVGYDSRTDLAVLKINAKDLTPVKFGDSSFVEIGQDIITIGNPGGSNFQNSLTKGIVSALNREIELDTTVKFIQIDAPINPGNSGGPLCNIYGQVIGINTAKIASSDYEGMGFAIPSSVVVDIVNDLIHYGYVQNRVMIGISGIAVDYDLAQSYSVPYGILIADIIEDGPFDNTDIRKSDIITEIDGESVTSFSDIYNILENYKEGDKVSIKVYRLEE